MVIGRRSFVGQGLAHGQSAGTPRWQQAGHGGQGEDDAGPRQRSFDRVGIRERTIGEDDADASESRRLMGSEPRTPITHDKAPIGRPLMGHRVVVSVPISKLLSDALGLVFADRPLSYSYWFVGALPGRHRPGAGGRGQPAAVLASQPPRGAPSSGLRMTDGATTRSTTLMTRPDPHHRHRRRARRRRDLAGIGGLGPASQPHRPRRWGRCPSPIRSRADARALPIRRAELAAPAGGGVVAEVLVEEGRHVKCLDRRSCASMPRGSTLRSSRRRRRSRPPRPGRQAQGAARRRSPGHGRRRRCGPGERGGRRRRCDADGTPSGAAHRAANAEVVRARAGLRRHALSSRRARARQTLPRPRPRPARRDGSLQGRVDEAQAAVADLTLEAPFAGIVASLDAIVGQTVRGRAHRAHRRHLRMALRVGRSRRGSRRASGRRRRGHDHGRRIARRGDPARVALDLFVRRARRATSSTRHVEPDRDLPAGCGGT